MQSEGLKYHAVLDIGNTSVKGAIFLQNDIVEIFNAFHDQWQQKWLGVEMKYPIHRRIFSNVAAAELAPTSGWRIFDGTLNEQWNIRYENSGSLGVDRIAAALGARSFSSVCNLLVVDLGSCITYTGVMGKEITGLAISPGRNMRWSAMHQFTARLPKIDPLTEESDYQSYSTNQNLFFGGHIGWREEIFSMCALFKTELGLTDIIFTGTDAVYLNDFLKEGMCIKAHLNLIGMNNWLYEG